MTLSVKCAGNRALDLSKLSGEAVRLRFVLHDADLFAYQFV